MTDFCLVMIINVLTLFFRKLLDQMLKRVNGLKEYCEQYHQSHPSIGIA